MSSLNSLIEHLLLPLKNETQAQRLFHGRGHAYDNLHHVTVDWLPPVLLITLFAPEDNRDIDALTTTLLQKISQCESLQLQHRYEMKGPIDVLWGDGISQLVIQENTLKYQLKLGKSRNTGLFLDMQNGRRWVQNHSDNKRVLNLFSYTCGFSVAAIAGGAKTVLNVDMSSAALSVGRENHRLNDHDLKKVKFEKLNIFNSFGRLKRHGPYDLLICDPPTLQKGSVDIKKDYPKIMRRLTQFMAPDSTVILCLNAPELGRNFLKEYMTELSPDFQYIKEIKPPDVYADAQNKGLKVLLFKRQL